MDNLPYNIDKIKNSGFCLNCDLCESSRHRKCVVFPKRENDNETWKVLKGETNLDVLIGSAKNVDVRSKSTSGGLLTVLTEYLLSTGEVDLVLDRGWGKYRLRDKEGAEQVPAIYVEGSYKEIMLELNKISNKKIAVISLPCMITSLRDQIEPNNIVEYSFSLFCGHLKQKGYKVELLRKVGLSSAVGKKVNFRKKLEKSKSASDYYFSVADNPTTFRMRTSFLGDWGSGPYRHKLCDLCMDAFGEAADASFGDAWHQPYENDKLGTSIVIVRNKKIHNILNKIRESGSILISHGDTEDIRKSQKSGIENKTLGANLRWNRLQLEPLLAINHEGWWNDKYLFRVLLNKKHGSKIYNLLLFVYFIRFVSLKSYVRRVIG